MSLINTYRNIMLASFFLLLLVICAFPFMGIVKPDALLYHAPVVEYPMAESCFNNGRLDYNAVCKRDESEIYRQINATVAEMEGKKSSVKRYLDYMFHSSVPAFKCPMTDGKISCVINNGSSQL